MDNKKYVAYVGTYTHGSSKGIQVYDVDVEKGTLTERNEVEVSNSSHTAISKFVLDRIFVCDKHKILFCQTPKVGNTQWKKVLIVLNGVCSAG